MWYWVCEGKPEHKRFAFNVSDPDYKQYKCPACGNEVSKRELDDTWDWAGPHCNECGCTGVEMFAVVTKKPIITGYQAIRAKFASILGWKKLEEIDQEI
jgi:ribosomal protein L37AE/L43A